MSLATRVATVAAELAAYGIDGLEDQPDVIERSLRLEWDLDDDEHASWEPASFDLLVVTAHGGHGVSLASDGYRPNERGYIVAIDSCARLLDGVTAIGSAAEDWASFDEVTLTWTQDGVARTAQPQAKYFDTSIVTELNRGLGVASRQLFCVDNLGMPSVIVALRPDAPQRLEAERGWSFHRAPAATEKPAEPGRKRRFWKR